MAQPLSHQWRDAGNAVRAVLQSRSHLEGGVLQLLNVRPDEHIDGARFDDLLHLAIPNGELFRAHDEAHGFRLAWF